MKVKIIMFMENKVIDMKNVIVLDRIEEYDASRLNCYAFRRGTDMVDGLSLALGNMVSGFPFEIEGVRFENSESAYIAGMFSDGSLRHRELQEALSVETNGFLAKKKIRRANRDIVRADWKSYNIQWMLYVVWNKVIGNADFRKVLLSLPSDAVIIEDSTFQAGGTAMIWGTKNMEQRRLTNDYKKLLVSEGVCKGRIKKLCDEKRLGEWRNKGIFVGKNLMGKILMICRDALLMGIAPEIDYNLLRSKKICFFDNILTFDGDSMAA